MKLKWAYLVVGRVVILVPQPLDWHILLSVCQDCYHICAQPSVFMDTFISYIQITSQASIKNKQTNKQTGGSLEIDSGLL